MSEWKQVTSCPLCGGRLMVSEFCTSSRNRRITKKGKLSKRWASTPPEGIDCTTASCLDCNAAWDADHVFVESDDTVWLRGDGE